MAGNKVKVTMLRDSWKTKAGDVRDVDKGLADQLVANGHAVRTTEATKKSSSAGNS